MILENVQVVGDNVMKYRGLNMRSLRDLGFKDTSWTSSQHMSLTLPADFDIIQSIISAEYIK